jgi:homoisocitrate dehydrogenase
MVQTTDYGLWNTLRILTIPGDGIGREVIPAAVEVLRTTGLPLSFEEADAGWTCFQARGTSLPDETLAGARAADAVLFGAVASPSHPVPGYRSPIVALRRALDLYANIRPVSRAMGDGRWTIDGVATTPDRAVDLVVVRENTEGLYAGRERTEDGGDTAIAERVITRRASERIVRAAFELARGRRKTQDPGPRTQELLSDNQETTTVRTTDHKPQATSHQQLSPRVTVVHKANVLRETCGLFRRVALEVAQDYPDVACGELLVDTCALQLVQRPEHFDVIVTTNLYGDILSDVASYWGGGLGIATSANLGEHHALFEPVHGAAPDIAGKGIANPIAAIGCAALLLDYLAQRTVDDGRWTIDSGGLSPDSLRHWADRIRAAVASVTRGGPHTPDLGGTASTAEVVRAVIARL